MAAPLLPIEVDTVTLPVTCSCGGAQRRPNLYVVADFVEYIRARQVTLPSTMLVFGWQCVKCRRRRGVTAGDIGLA